MKRILILNHNQKYYGTWFRCNELGLELSKNGYEVHLVCASDRDIDFLIRTKKISENFKLTTLPRLKYHKFFTGQLIRLLITIAIVIVKKYNICYAFTVSQPQIFWPAILSKLKGKFLIIDWDDLWGGGFAEQHNIIVNWILTTHELKILKYADKITYASDYLGLRIKYLKLPNHKKIPNGTCISKFPILDRDESRKKLNLCENKKYIISVGNTYSSGLEILINSVHLLENTILVLIGKVDKSRIDKKLLQKIIFTGTINQSEIPLWFAISDAVFLPMDNSRIEKARFPMRLGDYLCSRKPIISNAVGEVRRYINKYDCGYIVSKHTAEAFAEKIKHVLSNKCESSLKIENAIQLASNQLSWKNIGCELVNYINEK